MKRPEYAQAGIVEYWISDPRDETVTVLHLQGGAYVEHGHCARGAQATSRALPSLQLDVNAVFDAH